jgi:hypothetical protein
MARAVNRGRAKGSRGLKKRGERRVTMSTSWVMQSAAVKHAMGNITARKRSSLCGSSDRNMVHSAGARAIGPLPTSWFQDFLRVKGRPAARRETAGAARTKGQARPMFTKPFRRYQYQGSVPYLDTLLRAVSAGCVGEGAVCGRGCVTLWSCRPLQRTRCRTRGLPVRRSDGRTCGKV